MTDNRYNKLAQVLVNYSNQVKKDDLAFIWGPNLTQVAEPLVREIYLEVLRAGGHPYVNMLLLDQKYLFFSEAKDYQLEKVSPIDDLVMKTFDLEFCILSSSNTRSLESIDPKKQQIRNKAYKDLTDLFMKRQSDGSYRWVVTAYPTSAYAQDAEMSVTEFTDFIFSATHVNVEDPVKYWKGISKSQQSIIDWFKGKEKVEISGEGIELSFSIKERSFINCDGKKNMPDGEIFTGPVEESVNGKVKFSYPCIFGGKEVNGVELTFEGGQITKASAEKNEEYLQEMIATDDGAKYLGEFGIGTNYDVKKFTGNMLLDEKIGGTIHFALGAGYPDSGSKNQSSIHWDMLTDMTGGGKLIVDDELIYESGKFLIS